MKDAPEKLAASLRALGAVLGAILFRIVYALALRFNMPAFMLKLVSSVIVVLAISGPKLKKQLPLIAQTPGQRIPNVPARR